MTKRREFSKAVKVEILTRCKVQTGFKCEACGAIVATGEIDHIDADGLQIDKSRKLTADDGSFLCLKCHKEKTKGDVAAIAKAKRREAAHLGIKDTPARKMQSRGFAPVEKPSKNGREKIDKGALAPLPRRNPFTREIIE